MSNLIQELASLKVHEQEKPSTVRLLRAILMVVLVAVVAVSISEGILGNRPYIVYALIALSAFLLLSLFLLGRGILLPARLLVPLSVLWVLSYLIAVSGGIHDISMIAYGIVLVLASLTLGPNAPVAFGLLIIAFVVSMGLLEIHGIVVNQGSFITSYGELTLFSIFLATMASLQRILVSRLNESLRRAQQSEQEQIRANRALQESEALYHSLVEALPMSVCRKDLAGRFTFGNRQFCDEFKKPLAEIVGKTDFDLHPVELADQYRQDDQRVIETSQILETVEEQGELESNRHYVQVFKSPLRDADGKIAGVQIMFWDVSERKRAEREREILQRLALELTAPLTLKELVRLLATCCRQLFTYGSFRFDLYDEQEHLRTPVYAEDTPADGQEPVDVEGDRDAKKPEVIRAVFDGRPVLVNRKPGTITDGLMPWGFASRRSQSMLFVPVRWQGHCIGVAYVHSYTPERYSDRDLMLLQMVADQCGAALARVQADEALRMNEQRYRALFERTNDAVFLLSPDGVHLAVNWRAAQLLGYSENEIVGMSSRQIIAPEEHAHSLGRLQALLAGEALPIYERTFVRKDGSRVAVEINAAVVYNQTGEPLHIQSIVRDITERKQAEQQLQQRLNELATVNAVSQVAASQLELGAMIELTGEKLRQILNVHAAYIALYDPQSNLISFPYWRVSDETIKSPPISFGTGLTSIVIRTREPLVINRDYERRSAELGVVRRQRTQNPQVHTRSWLGVPMQVGDQVIGIISAQNFEQEDAFTDDDVRLWSTIAANVGIAIQNAQLYTATQQELAERKQIQLEREKLIAELETKNAELERFTYTVSHDLKSPLVTIRGFLGFLEKDIALGNPERAKADVARITSAANRMQQLLNDLLELSRIGRIMNLPEVISFQVIAREAVELVRGRLQERGVRVEIASSLPAVFGDRARLVEVVQNLVDNAVKFMGNQPYPLIEIGQCGTESDGKPILFVRDNGIGIEPQFHDQVFGLFNKLDAQTEGTGVGLALVKRIIEVHGGRIWVESELGRGATFYFTLTCGPEQTGG